MLLPDALKKVVGSIIENGEYAPSTPSGSFSQQALAEITDLSAWADAVLLAGDFGRNSETAILLEKFLGKSSQQIIVTKDSVDYFSNLAAQLFNRTSTTVVLTMAQLQRLVKNIGYPKVVTFGMDLLSLVSLLQEFTTQYGANIVVKHLDNIFVSTSGKVTTTKLPDKMPIWRVKTAATCAVWWLQNPDQTLEALTSGIYDLISV